MCGTFDFVVFKVILALFGVILGLFRVILGLFRPFFFKMVLTQKWLAAERNGLKFGVSDSNNTYVLGTFDL